jgi:NADH-quinone oxidoreductase subunit L
MDHAFHRLQVLFPADDFVLLAVILALPLLGAFVNGVFGRRLGDQAVSLMGIASVAVSFVGSLVTFVLLTAAAHAGGGGEGSAGRAVSFAWTGWEWLALTAAGGSRCRCRWRSRSTR